MEVCDAVVSRLAMLGYAAAGEDRPALEYLISKCEAELLADIGHRELPDGLCYVLVDLAAASFLQDKLAAGSLEVEGLDFSSPVNSITEGDVSVTFAGAGDGASSAEARFRAKLDDMMRPPERILGAFRRLRW